MCGIAGCVVPSGERPERAPLERMAAAMRHRGPDDSGIEIVGNVGLVHCRLSIVDPSPAGHQPMRHPGGRWWLTYNGEVFNHRALRDALPPAEYTGGSDTETLLHALACRGEDAIPLCNGLFAYAALDTARDRLLLVRDRFGVKPLYTARWRGALWFASEIRALLAAGVPRTPREDLVRRAVVDGWVNGPDTPLRHVTRLLPGTLSIVDTGTLTVSERPWYTPADVVDRDVAEELRRLDATRVTEVVEDALQRSVERRLMGDVPIGTMCSGGLDSSLITALAAEQRPAIHAFNASVVDQPENDEGPWAELVASHLGVELHTVPMTAESWRDSLVSAVVHCEYPLTHESSVPMSHIAAIARDRGVKVLLSGEGADELFAGYSWTAQRAHADFSARRRRPELVARRAYRWLEARGVHRDELPRLRRPSDEALPFERAVARRAGEAYRHHSWHRRRLEGECLALLSTYLPHLLNRQDKNTMQNSIETRVPFLDPDLVRLAVNLPLEVKVEPRRKEILRRIGAERLPSAVLERPKVGFGFDAGAFIRPAARREFLTDGRLRELFGLERDAWSARVHALSGSDALRFWSGEIWARAFIDGEAPDAIGRELWAGGP